MSGLNVRVYLEKEPHGNGNVRIAEMKHRFNISPILTFALSFTHSLLFSNPRLRYSIQFRLMLYTDELP